MLFSKAVLASLTQFTQQYSLLYSPKDDESKFKKQYYHAQASWFVSVGEDPCSKQPFFVLNSTSIHADTGANAFVPPPEIEKVPRTLEYIDFAGYHYYEPSASLVNNFERTYKQAGYIPKLARIKSQLHLDDGLDDDQTLYLTYGGGSTEIFDATLRAMIKNKHDVVILPVPTYGLFVPLIEKYAKIRTMSGNLKHDYHGFAKNLSDLIESISIENQERLKEDIALRINLLSSVAVSEDLKVALMAHLDLFADYSEPLDEIDHDIAEWNELIKSSKKNNKISKSVACALRLEPLPKVRALFSVNPMMPGGEILTQAAIDALAAVIKKHPYINVIEDVTHRGIILDPEMKMGSFANSRAWNQTLTLDSLSKIWDLAGARAATLLGQKELIKPVAHELHLNNPTMNGASVAFLEAVYGLPTSTYKKHLQEMSEGYKERLAVVRAIIYGLDSVGSSKKKIRSLILDTLDAVKMRPAAVRDAKEHILNGIPNLKFYKEPEAGYFLLLDFGYFIGKYIGGVRMQSGMDIRNALFALAAVNTIPDILCFDSPGAGQGYVRFSLSMNEMEEIIEALLRMKKVLSCCTDTPSVTLAVEEELRPVVEQASKPSRKRKLDEILEAPKSMTPQFKALVANPAKLQKTRRSLRIFTINRDKESNHKDNDKKAERLHRERIKKYS